MYLVLILVLPFIGSLISAFLPVSQRSLQTSVAVIIAVLCALCTLYYLPSFLHGQTPAVSAHWTPAHDLKFSLRLDGFAWLFSLIITVMCAFIALYAHYYLSPKDPVRRFFVFLQVFMGSMLGVVLSGNLIQLVIFWELTSLSSFMLIAYWYHRRDARRGARMSLIITGGGGLALLAAMLMISQIVGSYDLETVLNSGDTLRNHPWYSIVVVLFALGALTKSAQFPFHIWLPRAMAAPTPVSAYLHSATMVKAGVFLMARFWPALAGTEEWLWIFGTAGLITLTLGAYVATFQRDMKGVLAYSTVSHLGLITLLLGLNTPLALVAGVFHIINHATFKASLFMAAGVVDHETGTRNLNRLSGLRHVMPITATLATIAAASMAGVPLLNGFISKEMFFEQTILATEGRWDHYLLPALAVLAGSFSVAYSLRLIMQVFFGPLKTQDLPRQPHEPPKLMLVPSAILVVLCLLIGVFPNQTVKPFLQQTVASILGAQTPSYSIAIWHGFNYPLLMSAVAIVGGILVIYILQRSVAGRVNRAPIIARINGRRLFEAIVHWVETQAENVLRYTYTDRLQPQVFLIISLAIVAAALPVFMGQWIWPKPWQQFDILFLLLWIGGIASAIGVAYFAKFHRPAALLLSGAAGLVTSLTFAWLSSPDLALTQLTVEVVTVVLILLGLRWLPNPQSEYPEGVPLKKRLRRHRDLILALVAGISMSLLAYSMMNRPHPGGVSSFMVENALALAGGSNVVNVILVDFRGFDTFGEITVLGIVALSVYALLRRFRPPVETVAIPLARRQRQPNLLQTVFEEPDPAAPLPEGVMQFPAVLVRFLMPIAVLFSVYFLLRGHNLPGGGFVGGLVMATAIILLYFVSGVVWVEKRPLMHPKIWVALGMLMAGGSALFVWRYTKPFLTAHMWEFNLPLVGTVHLSSTLFFDLGVYMLVVGSAVLMLVALAHQSLRFYRKLPRVHDFLLKKRV